MSTPPRFSWLPRRISRSVWLSPSPFCSSSGAIPVRRITLKSVSVERARHPTLYRGHRQGAGRVSMDLSGAEWFESSRSTSGGDCVEVAHLECGMVGVRDSDNPTGPALVFTPGEWDAFTARARGSASDRP
ncbi:DUF397 domain-containing protein [Nocardia sp. NPDC052278]|uniref:DUF397 domain-containing protein n=1 Tax=unclassified Nocardia TaxID=2637762 RepID=UPI00368DBF8D